MPLFDFRCQQCGHDFEDLITGEEQAECPSCQSAKVERQIAVFAVGGGASAGPPPEACGPCGDPRGPGS